MVRRLLRPERNGHPHRCGGTGLTKSNRDSKGQLMRVYNVEALMKPKRRKAMRTAFTSNPQTVVSKWRMQVIALVINNTKLPRAIYTKRRGLNEEWY